MINGTRRHELQLPEYKTLLHKKSFLLRYLFQTVWLPAIFIRFLWLGVSRQLTAVLRYTWRTPAQCLFINLQTRQSFTNFDFHIVNRVNNKQVNIELANAFDICLWPWRISRACNGDCQIYSVDGVAMITCHVYYRCIRHTGSVNNRIHDVQHWAFDSCWTM